MAAVNRPHFKRSDCDAFKPREAFGLRCFKHRFGKTLRPVEKRGLKVGKHRELFEIRSAPDTLRPAQWYSPLTFFWRRL
jgi:hypothetical protein